MVNKFTQARQILLEALVRHLVGPGSPQEVLAQHPLEQYHTGYLYPANDTSVVEDEDFREEAVNDLGPEEESEEEVSDAVSKAYHLRTIGLTFRLVRDAAFEVRLSWGRYRQISKKPEQWQRVPFEWVLPVSLQELHATHVFRHQGMEIRMRVRPAGDVATVTVSVINTGAPADSGEGDFEDAAFQVGMTITPREVGALQPREQLGMTEDLDHWRDEIRYRHARGFAVGHGCAAGWEVDEASRVTRIYTQWIPAAEVPRVSTAELDRALELDMKLLGEVERSSVWLSKCRLLADRYAAWIDDLHQSMETVVQSFPDSVRSQVRAAAESIIRDNQVIHRRLVEGIDRLERDPVVRKAFCLANQTMALSLLRRDPTGTPRWRAFQLAFILLALPSAVDRHHPDRSLFDLVWFPTGGGKTEAYLGLAALVLFYRRLRGEVGLGVLTRYTLRLLTVQQFERAARMICAAELVRRSDPELQNTGEMAVGLFVGRQLTPNSLREAKSLLESGSGDSTATTLPLVACPWCRTPLTQDLQKVSNRLCTPCPNPECEFHEDLPIRVVDEDIYAAPPDMVVATVDKLARMPWEGNMRALFRTGPDLIIQDELHLINESLGSMMGLYEGAIDGLALASTAPPKIIGSTATSRRTAQQVGIVFQRSFCQFPAGGFSAQDSFFYREDFESPGRLYVGVHAMGRSMPHSLERVAGILLHEATTIAEPEVRDQYWTLAVYFKALRELGGAWVLMNESVPRYLASLAGTGHASRLMIVQELTSHVPSGIIPEVFARLEQPILDLQTPEQSSRGDPIDVLLATNMISVGIDVDRLGVMVVHGQPHMTSEYIQATSRVGRRPEVGGLVVTIYNWARPRDRSIYENFVSFHKTIYRYVEPVTVTPYSTRARERALHAVLFALVRLGTPEFNPGEAAAAISDPALRKKVDEAVEQIVERVSDIDPSEAASTREHLNAIVAKWEVLAQDYSRLVWAHRPFVSDVAALMYPVEEGFGEGEVPGWMTLQSMRDVSPPCPIRVLGYRELRRLENE